MIEYKRNWFKFVVAFVVCLLVRLIPFRPPNIEPILATQMPFGKAYGKIAGFTFAFLSIVLLDLIVSKVGLWTWITACSYGLLGIWAGLYLKNKKNSAWNYATFAIMGTLAFDIVTGLSIGPLFYHQPFTQALVGQLPFTGMHLLGNVGFAIILSPALHRYVVANKKLENDSIINLVAPKRA